jgi:hypothetical protein
MNEFSSSSNLKGKQKVLENTVGDQAKGGGGLQRRRLEKGNKAEEYKINKGNDKEERQNGFWKI